MAAKTHLGWLFGHDAKKYCKYVLWAIIALYLISLIALLIVALRSFADVLVLFGALWLGALIGLLLGLYVQASEQWDQSGWAASILVIAGSIIFIWLRYVGDTHEIWFYPMGLVGGFIIGAVWKYAASAE
jgi:hypothetical protein